MQANQPDASAAPSYYESVALRIEECQKVVDQLESSEIWTIISSDCQHWINEIDSKWQNANPDQLAQLRVLKMAYTHLLNIRLRYTEEISALSATLKARANEDTAIPKDYDNAGQKESGDTSSGNYGI